MDNQRKIAVDLLNKWEEDSTKYLDDLLIDYTKLDIQQYGFIKSLVYGVVRYKLKLDYIIKNLSKTKFSKIQISLVNILRISLYQLIYMSHIPERAVVNEGVELSKSFNKKSSGFINGCLRNFIRNKNEYLKVKSKDKYDVLSIEYSFPKWLIKEIEDNYKPNDLEDVLVCFNKEPSFGIRTNKIKTSREELSNLLLEDYYDISPMESNSSGLIIKNPHNIFLRDYYKNGFFYVQSESSQKVGEILKNQGKFEKILDMCSAPGGKITHVYENNKGIGKYLACDISDNKLKLIRENINRLSSNNIDLAINDGTQFNKNFENNFDLIILDAPCSALGLIRKYPEIKYVKERNLINTLSQIQKSMIKNASKYVKKSGIISYSTCTFTKLENEDVIRELVDNKKFKLIEFIKISPLDYNSDGFSISIIKRID